MNLVEGPQLIEVPLVGREGLPGLCPGVDPGQHADELPALHTPTKQRLEVPEPLAKARLPTFRLIEKERDDPVSGVGHGAPSVGGPHW